MLSTIRMCARGCAAGATHHLRAATGAAAAATTGTGGGGGHAATALGAAASLGATRGFRKAASKAQRRRHNNRSGKYKNKHYQKGRGAPLEGRHTARGGFVWMPERALDLVVPERVRALMRPDLYPDAPAFNLKPYVHRDGLEGAPGPLHDDPLLLGAESAPPPLAGGLAEHYARLQKRTQRAGREPAVSGGTGAGGVTAALAPRDEVGRSTGPKLYAQQKKGRRSRQMFARRRRQRLLKEIFIKR